MCILQYKIIQDVICIYELVQSFKYAYNFKLPGNCLYIQLRGVHICSALVTAANIQSFHKQVG